MVNINKNIKIFITLVVLLILFSGFGIVNANNIEHSLKLKKQKTQLPSKNITQTLNLNHLITCNDSDGGNDPFLEGMVITNIPVNGIMTSFILEDTCSNTNNALTEFYCENETHLVQSNHECQNGCYNNACIPNFRYVNNCEINFTNPGTYILTQDLLNCMGLKIETDNIELDCDGYAIKGINTYIGHGIDILGADNISIKNCDISKFYTGINIEDSNYFMITNNKISQVSIGIESNLSDELTIKNNEIKNTLLNFLIIKNANWLEFGNEISNNILDRNGYFYPSGGMSNSAGIELNQVNQSIFKNNKITGETTAESLRLIGGEGKINNNSICTSGNSVGATPDINLISGLYNSSNNQCEMTNINFSDEQKIGPGCARTCFSCSDSDEGIAIFNAGSITANFTNIAQSNASDYCTGNTVTEFYCDQNTNIAQINISCPSGYNCSSGECIQQSTQNITGCIDYDPENNYSVNGLVLSNNAPPTTDSCRLRSYNVSTGWQSDLVDTCEGTDCMIRELTCSYNGELNYEEVGCPQGCSYGACLPIPDCFDSDNGLNYYEKGTIVWTPFNLYLATDDYCMGDSLIEFECIQGSSSSTIFNCLNGCSEGACILI
jgi:parallel beta-helix repeat protein